MKVIFIIALIICCSPVYANQVIQMTSGWCSPTVANVIGNVTIICNGVSPAALRTLNQELNRLQLQSDQRLQYAERWAFRYSLLKSEADQAITSPVEIKEINRLILDGNLEGATRQLDERINYLERQKPIRAELYYLRANIYYFKFDVANAIRQVRQAYLLDPTNIKYILMYSSILMGEGDYAKSERIVNDALPGLRAAHEEGKEDGTIAYVAALDLLGSLYISNNKLDRINEVTAETLTVIDQLINNKQTGTDVLEMAATIAFSIGRNSLSLGELDKADDVLGIAFSTSLQLCRSENSSFCITAANAIMLTGTSDLTRKNYARAIERFRLAKDTLHVGGYSKSDGLNELRAKITFGLAEAHLNLGQLAEAEEKYKDMYNAWQKGEYLNVAHRSMIAHANNKLGEFAMARKQYSIGEAYFKQALSLTSSVDTTALREEKALALVNLGHYFAARENGSQALNYASQAADIFYQFWVSQPNAYKTFYARALYVKGVGYIQFGDKSNGCRVLLQVRTIESGGAWDNLSAQYYSQQCH